MDLSPFPSLAVPGVPNEPHNTVPRVPPGTKLDLSWEVTQDSGFTGAGCFPTWEGTTLWQSWDVPPQHMERLGQSCGTGDKSRDSTQLRAAGGDLGPRHSLPQEQVNTTYLIPSSLSSPFYALWPFFHCLP